jgi:transposase-like protein
MAEIKKTYTVEEKRIAIELYNRDGLPFSEIAREFNIPRTNIRHWVNLYEREGLADLEEKRGKAKGLHSDQGFQYTHKAYNRILQQKKMVVSMSRKGKGIVGIMHV